MTRIERIKRLIQRKGDLRGLIMLPCIISPVSIELAKKEISEIERELDSIVLEPIP